MYIQSPFIFLIREPLIFITKSDWELKYISIDTKSRFWQKLSYSSVVDDYKSTTLNSLKY